MTVFELEERIKEASQAYYEGKPICSDIEFDALLTYLRSINPNSQILYMTGYGYDPYKQVGKKEHHLYGNVVGISKKPRNINNIPKEFFNNDIIISAKLDGLSIVCYFVDGKFTKALTRGRDGIGINRTDKVEKILTRELNLPNDFNFTGAIRGEICISNKQWQNMINQGIVDKDSPSVNPRNVAAGIIGRDVIDNDINFLDLVFYKVIGFNDDENIWNKYYKEHILENKKYDVEFLKKFIKNEFIVDYVEDNGSMLTQNSLETLYNQFNDIYMCDGCVITKSEKNVLKLNDKHQNKIALENDEIAYKFEGEKAITNIENIRWKMSKGNKAIPVINVTPVELSGTIVQNASAYNAKYVYDNDLDIGCQVELTRSGEVIPMITKIIISSNGTGREKLNNMTCPCCENKLKWSGVDLICANVDCTNRDKQNLKVWISNIAQIDGISEKLIFKFLEELNINSLNELYSKDYNDLTYNNAPENSHKGKFNRVLSKLFVEPINWSNALMALNIKMIGKETAKKLINNDLIQFIKDFLDTGDSSIFISNINELINISGPAVIKSLSSHDSLSKLKNLAYIQSRLCLDEIVTTTKLIPIVVTGKLSISRKKFEEYLNENGYEVKNNVSKDVKYLITDNKSNGTKYKKAKELNIDIISEDDIRNIIKCK